MTNERKLALQILLDMYQNNTQLNQIFQKYPDINPAVKNLCYGFCRYYFQLEVIAAQYVKKRPKKIQIWFILLLGLYQLGYLKKAPYAVVNESVALLAEDKLDFAKGLVNAVLRNAARALKAATPELKALRYRYNHPDWFVSLVQKHYPLCWQRIFIENDNKAPMTLRVNRLQTTTEAYLKQLEDSGLEASMHPYAKEAIVLKEPCPVNTLPNFDRGAVSVQDAAAQLAASLLQLKPGLTLLDACAAPGGKTGHILESEPNLKHCLALDIDERRLLKIKENLKRLKLSAELLAADARSTSWSEGGTFDRILLDAPCSATGVIRRHPDIKLLRKYEDLQTILPLQQALLSKLWSRLLPGGLLVYATCSVLPEENEAQIKKFIDKHPDAEELEISAPWGLAKSYGRQILPGESDMDGFYYCVLHKEESR